MSIILATAVGKMFSKGKDTKGRVNPDQEVYDLRQNRRSQSMMNTIMRNNDRSNNKSAGTGSYARKGAAGASRGPTVAQQVAARAAAKLKAKKAKGQARRKKYEAAETMAKKMKLIFVD
jgi:hypothetical protein